MRGIMPNSPRPLVSQEPLHVRVSGESAHRTYRVMPTSRRLHQPHGVMPNSTHGRRSRGRQGSNFQSGLKWKVDQIYPERWLLRSPPRQRPDAGGQFRRRQPVVRRRGRQRADGRCDRRRDTVRDQGLHRPLGRTLATGCAPPTSAPGDRSRQASRYGSGRAAGHLQSRSPFAKGTPGVAVLSGHSLSGSAFALPRCAGRFYNESESDRLHDFP